MTTSTMFRSERVDTQEQPWTLGASFSSLIIALAVAALTLSTIGTALHLVDPRFTFSLVRAAHQSWAWISILILSVVWLGTGVFHVIRSVSGERQERGPATSCRWDGKPGGHRSARSEIRAGNHPAGRASPGNWRND